MKGFNVSYIEAYEWMDVLFTMLTTLNKVEEKEKD